MSLATRVDLFENLGVANCLLDCPAWQKWQEVHGTRPNTREGQREKKRRITELKRAAGARSGKGAVDRRQFNFDALASSATSGCGVCGFIFEILEAYLKTRLDLNLTTTTLRWTSYAFNLELRDTCSGISVNIELFAVNIGRS